MLGRHRHQKGSFKQRGIAVPTFVIAMLALIGVGGLAIDISNHYVTKTLIQNALDSAALAGAKVLNLTDDQTQATAAALEVFNMHLSGKLSDSGIVPTIEYSNILNPFTPGGADPDYIRASVSDFDLSFFIARILPGVGDTQRVIGSAVAGPIPLSVEPGTEICDVAPILLCGEPGDTNCGDGSCFGYDLSTDGTPNFHELKTGAEPGDDWEVGPGNFQLLSLSCGTGANCVRSGLAGGEDDLCVEVGATTQTEPGNTVGPVAQGFNTRFGQYQGGQINSVDHPSDTKTQFSPNFDPLNGDTDNSGYWYSDYVAEGPNFSPSPVGVPGRRILTVPVGRCDGTENGRGDVEIYGAACMFMLKPVTQAGNTQWIHGQIIPDGCDAQGSASSTPVPPGDGSGPYKIVLYKNSDSIGT